MNTPPRQFEFDASARTQRSARASRLAPRSSLAGMTLVELLVVIVILVSVLAGVIPLLSPNNDARKIREAGRQLNSMFAQAQAQAARDGRPAGVAFREFGRTPPPSGPAGPFSGMAVEAFFIAEPPRFGGFSESSRVAVIPSKSGLTYGVKDSTTNPNGNGGTKFDPKYRGFPLYDLNFVIYGTPEDLPPGMLRPGDTVSVGGNDFLIVDDSGATSAPNMLDANGTYLDVTQTLTCVWANFHGQAMAFVQPPVPPVTTPIPIMRPYVFRRLPANSTEQPVEFPNGIGIDMDVSGSVGGNSPGNFDSGVKIAGVPPNGDVQDLVAIMFGPNGGVESLYFNGEKIYGVERVHLLLGRLENGNNGTDAPADRALLFDFSGTVSDDDLAERRQRLNWLNPDSMWVSISGRSGRVSTSEVKSFDPRHPDFVNGQSGSAGTPAEQRARQVATSRDFAIRGQDVGGR